MLSRKLVASAAAAVLCAAAPFEESIAVPYWDLTGTYTIYSYWYGGSGYASTVVDTMDLTTGTFSGTSLNIGWDPSWFFTFSGTVTENTFSLYAINLAHNHWGTETGSISSDGSLIDIVWVDRYGGTSYGWSVAGHATPVPELPSLVLCIGGLVGIAAYRIGMVTQRG